jgi:hypothetical protein
LVRHNRLRPICTNHAGNLVELSLIGDEARVDRGGICNHAEAQTGRAAAIGHRLAHIDGDWYRAVNDFFASRKAECRFERRSRLHIVKL